MNLPGLRFRAPAAWSAAVLCRFSTKRVSRPKTKIHASSISRPLAKRQRTGAVQDLAEFPAASVMADGGSWRGLLPYGMQLICPHGAADLERTRGGWES